MAGQTISWDKFSLKINERRRFIVSGEFHYWRVPDGPERWLDLLKMYRAAGLNAVRIYYHWGFHSRDEGVYEFEGNRDIEYLHRICEDLGLLVLAAPGPYICSETQAGGFPFWLLAKRNIRIKHLKTTGISKYDPEYMKYCRNWYNRFVTLMRPHQITENPRGCVVAFQVENEYFEKLISKLLIRGNRRYMRELVECARDFGTTVPTFHNDGWDAGSWNGLVDLYGFDKYPVWAPKDPKRLPLPQWSTRDFSKKVDGVESNVRGFGGAAAESPIFIPELQGGWFNHWGIKYGFDELYDFYGPNYQKVLLESFAAQGSTMMSLYMFYGGTNWGTIADPDVYTSYDYSGAIREYGFQSERFREVRLFNLFARSFEESFASTYAIPEPTIRCDAKDMLNRQRVGLDGTDYFFFRNFNSRGMETFSLHLADGTLVPKGGVHRLLERDSFVAFGNHHVGGFRVKFCSLPVVFKGDYADGALLVLYLNGGELLLEGTGFEVAGVAERDEGNGFTRLSFPTPGTARVENHGTSRGETGGKAGGRAGVLYILALTREEALTFNAEAFRGGVVAAWGPYSLSFAPGGVEIEAEALGDQRLRLLHAGPKPEGFSGGDGVVVPGYWETELAGAASPPEVRLGGWEEARVDWFEDPEVGWQEINFKKERDPLYHGFTSGHVLYKCSFHPFGRQKLTIRLNTRHKCALYFNGKFVGGHHTYSTSYMKAGAKNGPDPHFLGARKYDLTDGVVPGQENVLVVLVESLGQNRIPFVVNDVRNPRGILSAKFSPRVEDEHWYISGVDVRAVQDPYNTCGLPGEKVNLHLGEGVKWATCEGQPEISPENAVRWFKTNFSLERDAGVRAPLRLHLDGMYNASVFLNGHFIGRYWGEMGPQHDFYLMDYFLEDGENVLVLACWTTSRAEKIEASVLPYIVDPRSGNIDEEGGVVFATKRHHFQLSLR
ncbi:MAG: beta-galactosidase [Promethearchaeota archaeon]